MLRTHHASSTSTLCNAGRYRNKWALEDPDFDADALNPEKTEPCSLVLGESKRKPVGHERGAIFFRYLPPIIPRHHLSLELIEDDKGNLRERIESNLSATAQPFVPFFQSTACWYMYPSESLDMYDSTEYPVSSEFFRIDNNLPAKTAELEMQNLMSPITNMTSPLTPKFDTTSTHNSVQVTLNHDTLVTLEEVLRRGSGIDAFGTPKVTKDIHNQFTSNVGLGLSASDLIYLLPSTFTDDLFTHLLHDDTKHMIFASSHDQFLRVKAGVPNWEHDVRCPCQWCEDLR